MKQKRFIIVVGIIIAICFAGMFFIKSNEKEFIYSPTIEDIDNFKFEDGERYIILYDTKENKCYLGQVSHDILKDKLFYLGDAPCNFKKINHNLIVISNSKQIVYSNGKYNQLPKDVYDIQTLGHLEIAYDIENHDMDIYKRGSELESMISLKFEYYNRFIPVDTIMINENNLD